MRAVSEQPSTISGPGRRIEDAVTTAALAVMALLPVAEMVGRILFDRSLIPGSIPMVQHLTLWVAMLGAALAARSDRLLALSTANALPDRFQPAVRIFAAAVGAGVTAALFLASADLVRIERGAGDIFAWGVPVWVAMLAMPVSFGLITARLVWKSSGRIWGRLLAGLGMVIPAVLFLTPDDPAAAILPLGLVLIGLATVVGMPIFAAIAGLALVLFLADGTPLNAVPARPTP